jgi:hypothetical protein
VLLLQVGVLAVNHRSCCGVCVCVKEGAGVVLSDARVSFVRAAVSAQSACPLARSIMANVIDKSMKSTAFTLPISFLIYADFCAFRCKLVYFVKSDRNRRVAVARPPANPAGTHRPFSYSSVPSFRCSCCTHECATAAYSLGRLDRHRLTAGTHADLLQFLYFWLVPSLR